MLDFMAEPYPLWFCLLASFLTYLSGICCERWWTSEMREIENIIEDLSTYESGPEARAYLMEQITYHKREGSLQVACMLKILLDKL